MSDVSNWRTVAAVSEKSAEMTQGRIWNVLATGVVISWLLFRIVVVTCLREKFGDRNFFTVLNLCHAMSMSRNV